MWAILCNYSTRWKLCCVSSVFKKTKPLWATGTSAKGKGPYRVVNQNDGNLVLYDSQDTPTWSSGTCGKATGATRLEMQTDGNLVLYDAKRKPHWASNTCTEVKADKYHGKDRVAYMNRMYDGQTITSLKGEFKAVVQGDGNFVVYQGTKPLWSSKTEKRGSGCSLEIHEDNNVVLYDAKRNKIWATQTADKGKSPVHLIQQDDGNLVLYDDDGKALWASKSCVTDDTLTYDRTLHEDQSLSSQNGVYKLTMQGDGNLVLYKEGKKPIWASNTCAKGTGPYKLVNQADGNLVLYDSSNKPHFSSGTCGKGNKCQKLVVQDDGNCVLYEDTKPLWSTQTSGK